jgi:hypothetical protein
MRRQQQPEDRLLTALLAAKRVTQTQVSIWVLSKDLRNPIANAVAGRIVHTFLGLLGSAKVEHKTTEYLGTVEGPITIIQYSLKLPHPAATSLIIGTLIPLQPPSLPICRSQLNRDFKHKPCGGHFPFGGRPSLCAGSSPFSFLPTYLGVDCIYYDSGYVALKRTEC